MTDTKSHTGAAASTATGTPATSTTIARRTWEPRTPTAEPLVELTSDGKHAPTGRRVAVEQRQDGRGGYGLDERENVAFYAAVARINAAAGHNSKSRTPEGASIHTSEYDFLTRDEARYAGEMRGAARIDAIRDWRAEFPLPTAFAELPEFDPSNNYVPDSIADPSAPGVDPNVTKADRDALAAAAFVPITDDTPLDPDEEAAAYEESLRAGKVSDGGELVAAPALDEKLPPAAPPIRSSITTADAATGARASSDPLETSRNK